VAWFAEALAAQARALREPIDEVTWVPARPPNRRRRGFDQAEALACAVGEVLGTPASATLLRHADGGQTGRSRIDRLAGPALAPAGTTGAPGATVLVVDDVATTGATLRTAAALLKESGAGRVVAAVVAHPRGPRSDLRTSLRGPGGSTVGHPQTTQGEGAPWT
jgi:predicted amidophosphoribosyltransferase